jgi:hypothetical protein
MTYENIIWLSFAIVPALIVGLAIYYGPNWILRPRILISTTVLLLISIPIIGNIIVGSADTLEELFLWVLIYIPVSIGIVIGFIGGVLIKAKK